MVIRVVPETQEQFKLLQKMQEGALDFWSAPSGINQPVDIRVSPKM